MNTETPPPAKNSAPKPAAPKHSGPPSNKWGIAAAAIGAIAVLGIGYAAFNGNRDAAPRSAVALNDTADTEFGYGAPVRADGEAEPAAAIEAPDATADRADPAPRRVAAARAEPVEIEQTVGVGPSGATVQPASLEPEEEAIIVEGRRTLRPQWVRTPSEYRLTSAYPDRALSRGDEGEARVRCMIADNGAVSDCQRLSEYPQNAGFGMAAERVARSFRHSPQLENGAVAAGTPVNFRVLFRLEDAPRRGT